MAVEGLPDDGMKVTAKIRYSHKGAPCMIRTIGEDLVECVFDDPQRVRNAGTGRSILRWRNMLSEEVLFYDKSDRMQGAAILLKLISDGKVPSQVKWR